MESILFLLVLVIAPFYLGSIWIASHFLSRDEGRRRALRIATGSSLGMTTVVALIGVPFTYKSTRMPALYAAMALLVAGPLVLPRLRRRGRQVLAAALLILFGLPILRVEYLTLRHGPELRAVYDAAAGPGSSEDALLFSVFDYSTERAKVLRVEGSSGKTFGYFLHFRRSGGRNLGEEVLGAWDVDIHPQAVLWSDAGSAFVACPYPTSVLLLLRGTGSFKC